MRKHEDFLRDFRGDTIHPATLQVLDELGALQQFLAIPHTRMERVTMDTPSGPVTLRRLHQGGPPRLRRLVPQWDFLDFLADRFARTRFDRVITLCDKVKEVFPDFPGQPTAAHWSMADPATEGTDDDTSYPAFVRTADEIDTRVALLIGAVTTTTPKEKGIAREQRRDDECALHGERRR